MLGASIEQDRAQAGPRWSDAPATLRHLSAGYFAGAMRLAADVREDCPCEAGAERRRRLRITLNDLGEEGRLPKLVGVLALTAVYWFPVRRWFSRWGTTPEELARVMPGDVLIANATEMSMQAVTVNAPPEDIWPWLVQIGYQRGGLYSYDWLDRLFGFLDRPSATHVLPEFQHLAVGDKIPWGRAGTELTVGVLEPLRALALSYEDRGFKWVWQFGLYPLDDQRTRFVTRGSEHVPNNLLWWLGMRIMEPAAFIMTRRFLFGVKERAEALRAQTGWCGKTGQELGAVSS